ncbi:hypothetical protein [Halobacillus faecis]|uniref:Uncharacterized protein n=1 Tax=Halobacillus faecis TaxID=360184 RepID=A0A511WMP5_9BACI|nr:hypothetical protein [Halobacillus faecis]GEN52335.1 hypothetical protein HFA01_05970 [Halobacillus faecis]
MLKFICYFSANIFVLISPFFSTETVSNDQELENVTLGFPFEFVIQDQTYFTPPYPYETGLATPLEHPTTFNPLLLLASLFIANGLVYVAFFIRKLMT